jgi:hypothetical protein
MTTEPESLTDVFLIVGVRTSQGPGLGPKRLPASEANLLVSRKHAVHGDRPPWSYAGQPEGPDVRFTDNHVPQGSRADEGLGR